MNLTTKTKERQVSALPLKDYLRICIENAGLSNVKFGEAIGYKGNVVAMMKSGDMRLPVNKVKDTARVLDVDPVFLFEKVITETDVNLWNSIKDIVGTQIVSAAELELLEFVRKELDGHEVNLTERPEFVQVAGQVIREIAKRETEIIAAKLARMEGEKAA